MNTETIKSEGQRIAEQILNRLDACVYVTDLDGDEILFINDKMKNEFGVQADVVGHKCWKVLQDDFSGRCEFCPKYQLSQDPDTPVVWEEHNTSTQKYYRNTDCIVDWADGRKAHMQHSVDINDMKMSAAVLSQRLAQQRLMSAITQRFVGSGDFEHLTYESLAEIGAFMGADSAYIMQDIPGEQSFLCVGYWSCLESPALAKGVKVSYAGQMEIYNQVRQLKPDALDYVATIKVSDFIATNKVDSVEQIMVPLYVGNAFWGCLNLSSRDRNVWDEGGSHLAKLLSGVFSVALERREAEAKLYNAEQTLRTVIDNVSLAIFWKDTNSTILGGNLAFSNMLGVDNAALAGMVGLHSLSAATMEADLADDMEVVRTGVPLNKEQEVVFSNGQTRWLHVVKSLVKNAYGEPLSIVGIFEDITERKQLELDLVREKETAERASNAKTDFLSRMSHEIRTPMNAIIGMTDIASGSQDVAKIHKCLERIDAASKHLLGIINDILDMAKIEAQRLELTPHEFGFERMVMEAMSVLAFLSEEKKQTVMVKLDRRLPKHIISDEMRLKQVITNLLSNAVKFTPVGGEIRLNVELLKREPSQAKILVEIIDNGIGMDDSQMAKLFTAFEQGDGSITRKYGGTGLGLAICKQLVELMGGEIWVESMPGAGSKFSFTIHAAVSEADELDRRAQGGGTNVARVLAVDDSPEIREYFTYVLEGYDVVCDLAADGMQALEAVRALHVAGGRYDVIFVDWEMPGMNGVETAREIKRIVGENTIIIMISAFKWDAIERDAKAAGIKQFIPKPLFPSSLLEAIYGSQSSTAAERAQRHGARHDFRGYRILLTEDVEVNREIAAAILEDTGIEIEFAETGAQALELFGQDETRYDLILMDIHMPVMGGHEATRLLRAMDSERARNIPIIAMTADAFREDVDKCRESGMDGHIAKPVHRDDLVKALSEHLPDKPGHTPEPAVEEDFSSVLNAEEGIRRVLGNQKLYLKLLRGCRVRELTDRLIATIHTGDSAAAERVAHELKGVAANLSLTALANIASDMDLHLKNDESVAEQIPALAEAAETTIRAIEALCSREA